MRIGTGMIGYVHRQSVIVLLFGLLACSVRAGEKVEVVRDRWGVPHIFAATDAGAMYGLGYATAQDRGFQMVYTLRTVQGRLAEVIGDVRKIDRRESSVDSDRKMRSFGFYRAAKRVARNLDSETKELLEAYCAGVNAYFADDGQKRHELFGKLGLVPEPWTPADCIVSWWRLGQFFGTDGTRDLVASRASRERELPEPKFDDAAAVVQRSDVSDEWVRQVADFAKKHGLQPPAATKSDGPRFSHAWVVGKEKTTTGSAVLVSDPQTIVGNPSLFYEYHVAGASFNARGIGVAGSPMLLLGFSRNIAWGLTALGADQADLFRLQTDPARPDQYRFDGGWRDMEVVKETIEVKGGPDQTLRVRWTHFGPVITEHVFARPEDGEFAVKRIPICESDCDTIQAVWPMMRAASVYELSQSLARWRFPSANAILGDRMGNIAYQAIGALPVRSRHAVRDGMFPHDGSAAKFDWQGMIPAELLPRVVNPRRGYLYSANHRPIASFYGLYTGASTGGHGDTLRSWRLGERLAQGPIPRSADRPSGKYSPTDVLDVHVDRVNPARRDLVRLGLHLRRLERQRLSDEARKALEHLESWYSAGSPSDLRVAGAELAGRIDTFFRRMATPVAESYGGGESGLALFLKTLSARIAKDPDAKLRQEEAEYIDQVLANAWRSAVAAWGPDKSRWQEHARKAVTERKLGYFQSLDGFGSLEPRYDLASPALVVVDGSTIHSQGGQSYTQFVPLDNADNAQTMLPIGNTDRPDHPLRLATLSLWESGQLHPAPLSRNAVEPHIVERTELDFTRN